ncbi:MAG TPA: cellulose synthase operon protein YhjQ/BcsQ [Burkholderiales bacterium]|nr:cellulose synthase operon protein YhjQ/BcsQ [Burkholderiales bacterium]
MSAVPSPARRLGSLIRDASTLSDEDIDRILAYQKKSGLRFGESAVALRLVDRNAVIEALSRQFQYPTGFAGRALSSELIAAVDPFGDQAEAFRELRSRLLLEVLTEGTRAALTVASPDIGDGKTYLAANLAVAFSQLGEPTLLVDCDMRMPRLHRLLGVAAPVGVSNVLAGLADAETLVQEVPGLPNLYLLPAGAVPPNPLELLQRAKLRVLMRDMLSRFAHVIVDTPAAIRGADSRVVAAQAGAVVVIARRNESPMGPLEGLLAALGRGPAKVAGVVVNEH